MKKLLLLGGSRYILPIIEAAKKLGVYTITCDYLPDNIAHKYSDEYCNVSIIDKEAVLETAQKLQIDGIMSFACDPGVATAAYVAQKLNLPTCAPYESVSILQNKGLFRKFLSDNGFCVPTAKKYTDIRDAMQETEMFHWPVIVKPTDSAGSKGVTKVNTPGELEESVRYALSFSQSKEFIIEDFIEKQGYSSDSDCFSINGELVFCSFSDQRFDNCAANPYTPSAYSWPSSMPQQVQAELRSELQRLIRLLKLDTSIYNIETRWGTDGKPYIMEVSPRGGGNRLSEMLRLTSGVDLVTNAVRMALGEEIEGVTGDPVYDGCWAEIILHSEQDGAFDHLQIAPELQPCVKEIQLWVSKGDEIHTFTGANFAIGTLVLKFEDAQSLEHYVNNINDYVKVIVG